MQEVAQTLPDLDRARAAARPAVAPVDRRPRRIAPPAVGSAGGGSSGSGAAADVAAAGGRVLRVRGRARRLPVALLAGGAADAPGLPDLADAAGPRRGDALGAGGDRPYDGRLRPRRADRGDADRDDRLLRPLDHSASRTRWRWPSWPGSASSCRTSGRSWRRPRPSCSPCWSRRHWRCSSSGSTSRFSSWRVPAVPARRRQPVGDPPLLIILGLLAGGAVGGVLGAIVAIPLAGALRILVLRVVVPAVRRRTGGVERNPEAEEQRMVKA